jgi:hypothetical protein
MAFMFSFFSRLFSVLPATFGRFTSMCDTVRFPFEFSFVKCT